MTSFRALRQVTLAAVLVLGVGAATATAASASGHASRGAHDRFGSPFAFSGGEVTGFTSTSLTVQGRAGTSTTYTLTTATTFTQSGQTVTASALADGEWVAVATSASATTTATSVTIFPPRPILTAGEVTAVGANDASVTVTPWKGSATTFTINGSTTITQDRTTAPASALAVNELVVIRAAASTPTVASSIDILPTPPVNLSGTVTAVGANDATVTVTPTDGTATTFSVTASTAITEGRTTVPASTLATGERVDVRAAASAPTVATSISIVVATLTGTVSSVSGNTIVITDSQGFTRTIQVSASTTYVESDTTSPSLSDVAKGDVVTATGTVDANGTTLDATRVTIGTSGGWGVASPVFGGLGGGFGNANSFFGGSGDSRSSNSRDAHDASVGHDSGHQFVSHGRR